MSVTAGTISLVQNGQNSVQLACTAATGGTGPYTYQWYRSTTTGFSPGGGNILSGKTALTLTDTGLVPNTTYYYKLIATDTGDSNATSTSAQLANTTQMPVPSPNQFAQAPQVGMIDMRFDYNTVSVQIDVSQATALYAGSPVKMVDSADGVPKVIGCSADSDEVLGFINYDIKTIQYVAGSAAEISMAGNVVYLYATVAISRGVQVCLDLAGNGVKPASGSGGEDIVGWAFDKASSPGQLFRVFLSTPSFKKDA